MTISAWFTTPPEKRLPENDSAKHIADWLALNMLEDKLIDTTHETVIEYKPGNITVNGKSLSHEQNKKYTAMIDEVNNQSGSHPDTMTITVFAIHTNFAIHILAPIQKTNRTNQNLYFIPIQKINTMQKLLLTLALPAFLCTQAASAKQQLRPSLRDSLQKASDRLYEKGLSEFIMVDAIKDGVLQFDQPYKFVYNKGQLTFKDVKMSHKQNKLYTAKFETCLKQQQNTLTDNIIISITSDGITMKDVFDTTSGWWTRKKRSESDSAAHLGDLVLLKMLEDKLVEPNQNVEVVYKPGFISVNGKELGDPYAAKYIAMIEEVNKQSNSNPSTWSFSMTTSLDKLRYPQPGPEVKDK